MCTRAQPFIISQTFHALPGNGYLLVIYRAPPSFPYIQCEITHTLLDHYSGYLHPIAFTGSFIRLSHLISAANMSTAYVVGMGTHWLLVGFYCSVFKAPSRLFVIPRSSCNIQKVHFFFEMN